MDEINKWKSGVKIAVIADFYSTTKTLEETLTKMEQSLCLLGVSEKARAECVSYGREVGEKIFARYSELERFQIAEYLQKSG